MKQTLRKHLLRERMIYRKDENEFNSYYDIRKEKSSGITTGHEGEE